MCRTVLLVSKDAGLLISRDLLLRHAGYRTILTSSFGGARWFTDTERPDLTILCRSLGVRAQRRFTEELQEQGFRAHVVCLDTRLYKPEELLHLCAEPFAALGPRPEVRVVSGWRRVWNAIQSKLRILKRIEEMVEPHHLQVSKFPSRATEYHLESLLNLAFLCRLNANDLTAVGEYMRQTRLHLEALIEAEGLRRRDERRTA